MRFLFDNKYAPLTDSMSFIHSDIDIALSKYMDWILPQIREKMEMAIKEPHRNWNEYNQKNPIINEHNYSFIELMDLSQPLFYPEKRILFECKNGWVGYIENIITGTEIRRITQIASRINENKQSIGVQAWLNNYDKKANGWCGGSFSLYEGLNTKRHIMLSDQDQWEFDQSGTLLPFEDIEKYHEKLVCNRFTPEMLQKYLLQYGIDYFNDDFYMPVGSKAYIIEYVRDPYPNEIPKTLHQRRIEMGYEKDS